MADNDVNVTKLVGVEVSSKSEGKDFYKALTEAEDAGELEFAEVALVYKNDRGHIKRDYYGGSAFGVGASIGGGIGLGTGLAAAIGLINPVLGIGLLGGALAGGVIGDLWRKHFVGKDFLENIGKGLDEGKGYVIVATDDAGAGAVASHASTAGHGVAQIDVTAEFISDMETASTAEAEAASSPDA